MCGIAAIAALHGRRLNQSDWRSLQQMTLDVQHRGPESLDTHVSDYAGLGFTRLSLVAPENGGQPFVARDGLALVANGEVYNYKALQHSADNSSLATESDCEVLLPLYKQHGLEFLNSVNGMFSIIVYDPVKQQLLLARDRFGIKPLYFHCNGQRIVAASEIKALFRDPATPRKVDWNQALSLPYFSAQPSLATSSCSTWFQGIETVEPGTIVIFNLKDGTRRVKTYWQLPVASTDFSGTDEDIFAQYRSMLHESVVDCATADSGVGIFLSGGVDSSAVAALASMSSDVVSFSVVNAGTIANGDVARSAEVAAHLGLEHHQVVFPTGEHPTSEQWERLVWLMENPLASPEIYYKHELHRYAKDKIPGINAMLLGAACDEFHGGYCTEYAGQSDWATFMEVLQQMRTRASVASTVGAAWMDHTGFALVKPGVASVIEQNSDLYYHYLKWEQAKIVQYNVWHEDRTAAGSGIEARVPFLDHRLVEWVVSIPESRRQSLLWDKHIMRRAVADLLPPDIVWREKVPFFYGPGTRLVHETFLRMLTKDDCSLVEDSFSQPMAAERLDLAQARALIKDVSSGGASDGVELLLRLVNLGLLEKMSGSLPPPLSETVHIAGPQKTGITDTKTDVAFLAMGESLDRNVFIKFSDQCMLLHSATAEGSSRICYLVQNGSIEFEIDESLTPGLVAVLTLLSQGPATTGQIETMLDTRAVSFSDVRDSLTECLHNGFLMIEPI